MPVIMLHLHLDFLYGACLLLINYIFDSIFKSFAWNCNNGCILSWNGLMIKTMGPRVSSYHDGLGRVGTVFMATPWEHTSHISVALIFWVRCQYCQTETLIMSTRRSFRDTFVKSLRTITWNISLSSTQCILLKNPHP